MIPVISLLVLTAGFTKLLQEARVERCARCPRQGRCATKKCWSKSNPGLAK